MKYIPSGGGGGGRALSTVLMTIGRSNIVIVGSNPALRIDVCHPLLCCVDRDLAMGRSAVQGSYWSF
jgi:hypothetical protein